MAMKSITNQEKRKQKKTEYVSLFLYDKNRKKEIQTGL
jgi:hypothetical protein